MLARGPAASKALAAQLDQEWLQLKAIRQRFTSAPMQVPQHLSKRKETCRRGPHDAGNEGAGMCSTAPGRHASLCTVQRVPKHCEQPDGSPACLTQAGPPGAGQGTPPRSILKRRISHLQATPLTWQATAPHIGCT